MWINNTAYYNALHVDMPVGHQFCAHSKLCVCVRYTEKEAPQETHRQNANEEWLFHLFMGQC
jgi:hypothetical protein